MVKVQFWERTIILGALSRTKCFRSQFWVRKREITKELHLFELDKIGSLIPTWTNMR